MPLFNKISLEITTTIPPEAQLALLQSEGGRAKYYFVMVWGVGLAPPPVESFFKIKVLFEGFDVEKRKFSVVACRFGCVQIKSFFSYVFF